MFEVFHLGMTASGDGYPVESYLSDFGRCLEIQEQALILQFCDGSTQVVALYLHAPSLGGIHQTVDDAA